MSKEPLLCLCFILPLLCIITPMYFSGQAHAEGSKIIATHFPRQAQGQASEINVTDAEYVSINSTTYSADLIHVAQNVTSRIIVEYAESQINLNLSASSSLNQAAGAVSSRICVEYAESLFRYNLQNAAFPTAAPRIIVEYADSVFDYKSQSVTVPGTESRVVVEYADSIFTSSMKRPPVPLTSPPTTNISLNGVVGSEGWYTSDVIVNLSADTPVNKTEYSFDNAEWIPYTAPFTITKEGYNYVYYRSVDTAGNSETARTEIVRIDKTPPSGSISINNGDINTSSWHVTLTLDATDESSGVSQMCFTDDATGDPVYTIWEPFAASKSWIIGLDWQRFLRTQDSTATVYVCYMDGAGLTSVFSDTIVLNVKIPSPAVLNSQTNVTASSVLLSWTKNNDPDFLCYQILWSTQQSAPSTGYVSDSAFFEEMSTELIYDSSVVNRRVEALRSSTTYYFMVRTFNQQGIYADSNSISARTAEGSSPIIPILPWSLDTILLVSGSIIAIGTLGFSTPRMHRRWKTRGIRRINQAEESYQKGDLMNAAKLYAEAASINMRARKLRKQATLSVEWYARLARTVICQAALQGDKKILKQVSKTQSKLSLQQNERRLIAEEQAHQISEVGSLLEKAQEAQNKDVDPKARGYALDLIIDVAASQEPIQESIKKTLEGKKEIEIKDAASRLKYSEEITRKLLLRFTEQNIIKGYITENGRKFLSEDYVNKTIVDLIK